MESLEFSNFLEFLKKTTTWKWKIMEKSCKSCRGNFVETLVHTLQLTNTPKTEEAVSGPHGQPANFLMLLHTLHNSLHRFILSLFYL